MEFQVAKWQGAPGKDQVSLRAVEVTLPGGAPIQLQDQIDAEKKVFIGGQEMRRVLGAFGGPALWGSQRRTRSLKRGDRSKSAGRWPQEAQIWTTAGATGISFLGEAGA